MPPTIYRFSNFELDCDDLTLRREGRRLRLERKPLELLILFAQRPGEVISREEIAQRLWSDGVFVDTEHGINTAVRKLRNALRDDPENPAFVQTVMGRGYRFLGQIQPGELATQAEYAPPAPASLVAPVRPVWPWVLAGLVLATVGLAGAWRIHTRPRSSASVIHSLAVLPLANLSGDPGQDYFADGITDELITDIARIPNLRVVSRTSVMALKDVRRPLPEIARQLDVDAIVEGSIVRSGDRIRITAQLIDARSDRHLWAQSFEGPASDVLSLQDSVAQQIAQQARLVLAPSPPRPVNPAAHDAWLRGRYFFDKQDFAHAMEYYQQAISLDPNYASAYAGYASALDGAATFSLGLNQQLMAKALAAAQRAIQLDPQNGEAYTALGSIQTISLWDWAAAGQNLTRGIALNPNDSVAEFKYAVYLDVMGRPQDAVSHMRRAVELDPLSFFMNRRLGVTLYLAHDYAAALAQLNRAAEMENQPASIDNYRSLVYEQMGMRDDAVAQDLSALQFLPRQLDTASLRSTYQQRGWDAYWRARSHALFSSPPNACTAYQVAIGDLRTNDLNHAFDLLNRALDQRCFYMAFLRVDPLLDPVRRDPRYTTLLARLQQ